MNVMNGYYPIPAEETHTEMLASNLLPCNLENRMTFAHSCTPLHYVSFLLLLKKIFLQQQIQHKLSILNIVRKKYFASKIACNYCTLGLGVVRCWEYRKNKKMLFSNLFSIIYSKEQYLKAFYV